MQDLVIATTAAAIASRVVANMAEPHAGGAAVMG